MRSLTIAIVASAAILAAPSRGRATDRSAQFTVSVRVVRSIALSLRTSGEGDVQAEVRRGGVGVIGLFVPSKSGARLVRTTGGGAASGGKVVVLVDGAPTAIRFADAAVEEATRGD